MRRTKKAPVVVQGVTFSGMADKGKCVGRTPEGQVVFVENAAPGDVADVRIWKKKDEYLLGNLLSIHEFSPLRTEPFCQHYVSCGGCQWQHITYAAQLEHKQLMVENALKRIGKVQTESLLPIVPADRTVYYRNKLEFAFCNKKWRSAEEMAQGEPAEQDVLGYHLAGAYDKILDIEHCWLQDEPSNALRNAIRRIAQEQELTFFDAIRKTGFLRHIMIRVTTLGETLLLVSFGEKAPEKIQHFLDAILTEFPQLTTVFYCINPKVNDYWLDLEIIPYHGKGYIEEQLGHVRFKIGPKSFFQTNTTQATRLYDVVAEFAELKGTENVYDLYTGLGSIALYMAKRCKQIVGIEEVAEAIDDARANAELNGIDNAIFYAGDVKNILTEAFAEKHGKPDLLITDPPRIGMHPDVVRMLLTLEAPRLLYVSCNPATQARDLNLLSEKYEVKKSQPVDMFPHTYHIENVALLELKADFVG